ncbi:MAG: prmA [Candidatus Saccharibacteria bacterium]|jgi:release factor glutamine methyltransferase|nr:prmA [Candidatus Saccharibacteria bacterium]
MTSIGKWLTDAAKDLAAAEVSSSQLDAELILGHVLGQNRAWLKAHDTDQMTAKNTKAADALIARRANREPLVHITGTREFYGLDFEITPDVLTPRVETEQMVEWALKYTPKDSRLIDIGTGSGAIAIAIAKHRPDLHITATDISQRELAVARRNAAKHHAQLDLLVADLWDGVGGRFDTIVTNLPYLADDADLMPEVKREPAVALFGGPDGLGLYRRFLIDLAEHLNPGGYLFTECDPWQHEALIEEAARYGLTPVEQGYFILGFQLKR